MGDRMKQTEYPYLDMYYQDDSGISVEHWCESWSVDMHRHDYYEIMVVGRGSCRHMFHGVETLLIPGDVVVIPCHEEHGYALSGEISLYNCQFLPDRLDSRVISTLAIDGVLQPTAKPADPKAAYWKSLMTGRENMHADKLPQYEANSSKQGVLHLTPTELTYLVSLLQHTLAEQQTDGMLLKQKYVEIILLELKKAIRHQNGKYIASSVGNQKIIAQILAEMESDLTRGFDIAETARRYAFSPNYLRKLFTDFTGLSPIQYLNRLRMIRACEYIEFQGMNPRQAAELVGIYDLNYFSRLFKRFIGCTPAKM